MEVFAHDAASAVAELEDELLSTAICSALRTRDVIAAACVHLAAAVEPRLLAAVWIAQEYIEGHYDNESPVVIENGHIAVPDKPGLGVRPDPFQLGTPVATYAG